MPKIEALLSARLFLVPQLVDDMIYFLSNLNGHLNLYRIDYGGSIPEPLLPPGIALQNPHLLDGDSFRVFPKIGKIVVIMDQDGDEKYQPMLIPLEGGFPEPAFGEKLQDFKVYLEKSDPDASIIYLNAASLNEQIYTALRGNLATGELTQLGESKWGSNVGCASQDHRQIILIDHYSAGDNVLYRWTQDEKRRSFLFGAPLEERINGAAHKINSISFCTFTPKQGLLFRTSLFEDTYGLGYFKLDQPELVRPVAIECCQHEGLGELEKVFLLEGNRYSVLFNINGCSWLYEGVFDEENLLLRLDHVICGQGELSNGMLERHSYDNSSDRYVLSFSTARTPTQIYTVEGKARDVIVRHTNEQVLGIPVSVLSGGEDATFTSFDGTRISARLYLPSDDLGYRGPRPLVYYVHGGPHGQERPDFAWFSMPLIQFLTLNGFAVFVPNVRGSSGYGLEYMKAVDRDWGGKDRLDHVHAMTEVLPSDGRLDTRRTGLVGRSYGGYMTLMLAGKHPELWSAAVDMFGPFDLISFMDRIPETWKPHMAISIGDPVKDREHLIERSPSMYMENLLCPLLVIQGRNDPRVVVQESQDLVDHLNQSGKKVDLLIFENEGHDVLKYENRVVCYNAITDYFTRYLNP